MSEHSADDFVHTLRESGARYVVDTKGQPFAVLLTLEEYEHYLDLLEDETDSQDAELAARLEQAAARPTGDERLAFRDYLRQREVLHPDADEALVHQSLRALEQKPGENRWRLQKVVLEQVHSTKLNSSTGGCGGNWIASTNPISAASPTPSSDWRTTLALQDAASCAVWKAGVFASATGKRSTWLNTWNRSEPVGRTRSR